MVPRGPKTARVSGTITMIVIGGVNRPRKVSGMIFVAGLLDPARAVDGKKDGDDGAGVRRLRELEAKQVDGASAAMMVVMDGYTRMQPRRTLAVTVSTSKRF